MPRRYRADGTRLWNGKTPEEFTEADAYRFMAETEAVLQRKELMDDPAQPAPASGKEEFYLSKKDDVLLTPEQIAAEERRWLFDAPIAELAEVKGVSIDEAVKMRTDAVLQEAVVPITVSVRPHIHAMLRQGAQALNAIHEKQALLRDTLSQSAAIGHYGPPLSWQAQAGQRFLFPLVSRPRPSAP